jgi:hypothetical protein
MGDWYILASEYQYSAKRKITPDLGIYLASSWDSVGRGIQAVGVAVPARFYNYPFVLVDWPDSGVIALDQLAWLAVLAAKNIEEHKTVEIGCQGGHGRTGTLLACILGVVEDLDAGQSIKTLRKRYCEMAVESKKQVELVAQYLGGSVKGIESSKLPWTPPIGGGLYEYYTCENGVLVKHLTSAMAEAYYD